MEGWIGIPHGGISMGIMMDLAMTLDAYSHRDDRFFPVSADFRLGGTGVRIGDMLHFDVLPVPGGAEGSATVDRDSDPYLLSSIRCRERNGEHEKAFFLHARAMRFPSGRTPFSSLIPELFCLRGRTPPPRPEEAISPVG